MKILLNYLHKNCWIIAVLLVLSSCKKEKKLEATGIKVGYDLPQGNHAFDSKIVDFHKKYGSYIIYKFSNVDYVSMLTNRINDSIHLADPAYIEPALDFMLENCFNYYPDAFLKEKLPYKIYLGSRVDSFFTISINPTVSALIPTVYNMNVSNTMLTFAWANERFANLPIDTLTTIKGLLHKSLFNIWVVSGRILLPPGHDALLGNFNNLTPANMLTRGFLRAFQSYEYGTRVGLILMDFYSYIALITSTPYSTMQSTYLTYPNVLKKYNSIVNYYLTKHGIDLQAIGNASIN